MGENIVSKCKMAPELRHDEKVETYFGLTLGDVFRDNVIVFLTNQRLFVRPKKGRKVKDEFKNKSCYKVELSDIRAIRRTGALTKNIEIETEREVFEIEEIPNGSKELIEKISDIEGLEQGNWGQESTEKKATKGIIGTSLAAIGIGAGAIGAIMGVFTIILGVLLTLTIAGAIVGIPLIIIGYLMATGAGMMGMGGAKSGSWGLNSEEEWKRIEPRQKASMNNQRRNSQ